MQVAERLKEIATEIFKRDSNGFNIKRLKEIETAIFKGVQKSVDILDPSSHDKKFDDPTNLINWVELGLNK